MKTLFMFFVLSVMILAQQPSPIVKMKLQSPSAGKTYVVYTDVKLTNNSSVLVENVDPLKVNLTSYVTSLTNITISGDTTTGEFTIPVSDSIQYVNVAASITSVNKKPSLLRAAPVLIISPRENKPTYVISVEK